LSQLPSVVLALLVCPRPVPLLPIHFARRWLLPLPCLRLLQQLSLSLPVRPLCRLLWFRCSLLLRSQRLRRLLLQPLQWLLLQRLLVLFRWLQWLLRLLRLLPMWLLPLWPSLPPLQPELRIVFLPLLSIARALQAYPKLILLWPVRFALRWLLPLHWSPLQRPLLLMPLIRLLWRLSSLRWQSPLQLLM
jgi:hypothetical protein